MWEKIGYFSPNMIINVPSNIGAIQTAHARDKISTFFL
jgi:hypothetical protein